MKIKDNQYDNIIKLSKELINKEQLYIGYFNYSSFFPCISGLYINLKSTYAEFLAEYFFENAQSTSKKADTIANNIKKLSDEILKAVDKQKQEQIRLREQTD